MLSGYPSEVYDDLLSDWKTIEFQSMTRGGIRTEKLWMNYELESVFDTRFVGKNCMERQQIKRKAERWQEKYKKMPIYEQQAIMQALLEVHRD